MRARLASAVVVLAVLVEGASASAQESHTPPITADLADLPLYGIKDGLVYVRDPQDIVRLYPHAWLDLDAHGFLGSRVNDLRASEAGVDLGPRFFVRRARFDLGGELFERIGFDVGLDLVADPAIDGARVDGGTKVALGDAWANLDAGRGLAFMIGVFQAPFSMENRTQTSDLAMMERNLAIRGFVMPGGKALGAAIGGSTQHRWLRWDVGAFGAESITPGEFEKHVDLIGRTYVRPWAGDRQSWARAIQFGASGRVGARNPRDVTGDAPALNTGQGFPLWRPTHPDVFHRTLHVIPSGPQWAAGLELRVPIGPLVLRSEGYWVSRATREALEGYQATNTERLGRMQGIGWYAEISLWVLQAFGLIHGDPPYLGNHPHAPHLELARTHPKPERYGLEVALLGAGVNGTYDPAARSGDPDPAAGGTGIDVFQFGGAVNYWHTSHLRFSLDYNLYWAPRSGAPESAVVVPGNIGSRAERDAGAHVLHELGARTSVMF